MTALRSQTGIRSCPPAVENEKDRRNKTMLEELAEPLLSWYDGHARILPWREEPTPYRVWVSEIMLQQTRVEAVKPYYERFMEALPGIRELAACPEERLLKLWEGLGYYNRVRNLKKAAEILVEDYEGVMPQEYEAVLALPGIGSYTAGAVLSIAYGKCYPAVDGNVLRVLSRVTEDDRDILKQSVKKAVETELQAVMPKDRPGAFNQALMELGATVCVPNGQAKCEECPLKAICRGHRDGTEMEFPKKAAKKPRRLEERTVLVLLRGEARGIRKRPPKGLLSGLYELPNLSGHLKQEEVLEYLKKEGFSPLHIRKLPEAKHIFSHVEWQMIGYQVRLEDRENDQKEPFLFVEPERLEQEYPIPSAFAAYVDFLRKKK